MLGGYQLAGAPLAGSGFSGNNFTKTLTETLTSTDGITVTKLNFFAITLTEGIYDYDTYVVYNQNTHQQRDNITVNKRIRMGNTKPILLRLNALDDNKTKLARRNDAMRINLKR